MCTCSQAFIRECILIAMHMQTLVEEYRGQTDYKCKCVTTCYAELLEEVAATVVTNPNINFVA